jgi:ketosteroid isomerase-like protein
MNGKITTALRLCATLAIPAAIAFSTPSLAGAQSGPDRDAIMDTIQRYNAASEEATDAQDTSAERPLTTDAFYQQLQADMPAMWSRGVTSTSLVEIDFEQISVEGNTATATTDETWALSLQDGGHIPTDPDRNIYTLLKQQDGSWRIQADDHPGAGAL